ncbi:hypothetical protein AAMO2058_000208500 [Amorphochlora amoebiformis]
MGVKIVHMHMHMVNIHGSTRCICIFGGPYPFGIPPRYHLMQPLIIVSMRWNNSQALSNANIVDHIQGNNQHASCPHHVHISSKQFKSHPRSHHNRRASHPHPTKAPNKIVHTTLHHSPHTSTSHPYRIPLHSTSSTLFITSTSPYHHITISPYHHITISPYHIHTAVSHPHHHITSTSPYHIHITISHPHHHITISPYHIRITISHPHHHITSASPYHIRITISHPHHHITSASPYHIHISMDPHEWYGMTLIGLTLLQNTNTLVCWVDMSLSVSVCWVDLSVCWVDVLCRCVSVSVSVLGSDRSKSIQGAQGE